MDVAFTHAGAPGISLWHNVAGKKLERVATARTSVGNEGWGLTWVDFDNDGWLDLVAVGESAKGGEVRLLRNLGDAGWADVSKKTQLDAVKLDQPHGGCGCRSEREGKSRPDYFASGRPPRWCSIISEQIKNSWMQIAF